MRRERGEEGQRSRKNRRKGISAGRGRGCVRVKTQAKNAKQKTSTVKTARGRERCRTMRWKGNMLHRGGRIDSRVR